MCHDQAAEQPIGDHLTILVRSGPSVAYFNVQYKVKILASYQKDTYVLAQNSQQIYDTKTPLESPIE